MRILIRIVMAVVITVLVGTAFSVGTEEKPKRVLFKNIKIFNGQSERLAIGQDLLIENNLIKKIGKEIKADAGATVIDGEGMTMTPGLIDMHQHLMLGGPGGLFSTGGKPIINWS